MRWTLEPLRHACTSQSPLYKTFPLGWSHRLVTSPGQWSPKFFFNTGLGDGKHWQIPATKKNKKEPTFKKWMQSSRGKDCGAQFAPSSTIWIFLKPMSPQKDKPSLHQSSCTDKLHTCRSHLFNCLVKLAGISPPDLFFPLFCWGNRILCHHNSSWPWSLLRSWPMSGEVPNVFSKFQVIWIVGPSAIQREKNRIIVYQHCLVVMLHYSLSKYQLEDL